MKDELKQLLELAEITENSADGSVCVQYSRTFGEPLTDIEKRLLSSGIASLVQKDMSVVTLVMSHHNARQAAVSLFLYALSITMLRNPGIESHRYGVIGNSYEWASIFDEEVSKLEAWINEGLAATREHFTN